MVDRHACNIEVGRVWPRGQPCSRNYVSANASGGGGSTPQPSRAGCLSGMTHAHAAAGQSIVCYGVARALRRAGRAPATAGGAMPAFSCSPDRAQRHKQPASALMPVKHSILTTVLSAGPSRRWCFHPHHNVGGRRQVDLRVQLVLERQAGRGDRRRPRGRQRPDGAHLACGEHISLVYIKVSAIAVYTSGQTVAPYKQVQVVLAQLA